MRDGWEEVTIGDIADVVAGSTPSTREPSYWGGDIAWITPSEITRQEGQRITRTDRTITEAGFRAIRSPLLPANTVLLTSRATVGAVALAGIPMAINQGFAALVAGPRVLPEYLMYWCQANRTTFEALAGGSTFPEVGRPAVRSVALILPPLAEQRRIVDLIGVLDSAVLTATRAASAYIRMKQELASLEWGDTGLPRVPLARLVGTHFGGHLRDGDWIETRDQSRRDAESLRLLQLADIGTGEFLDKSDRWISTDTYRRLRCTEVYPGDLLVSRMADPVGRAARVPPLPVRMVTAVDVAIARLDPEVADGDYWLSMLSAPAWLAEIDRLATGSTRRRVTRRNLEQVLVPCPPIDHQVLRGRLFAALAQCASRAAALYAALLQARTQLLFDVLSGEHTIPASYDRFLEPAST